MTPSARQVTELLAAWGDGDREALDQLMPLVYEELRRLARRYMKGERPGNTLQTSALINEAYLRLVGQKEVRWQNRAHFFGVAAQMMRRILVDHARKRRYQKRGGGGRRVSLDEALVVSDERAAEVGTEALHRSPPPSDSSVALFVTLLRYFTRRSLQSEGRIFSPTEVAKAPDTQLLKETFCRGNAPPGARHQFDRLPG